MKFKTLEQLAFPVVVLLALHGPALAQTISGKVFLKGSTEYNGEDDGATDPNSDWRIDRTDTENGTIGMGDPGLLLTPGDQSNESVRHQLKRGFRVGEGVATAAFRISVNDVTKIGFVVGLYSEDDDPFSGQPTFAAYFTKPATSNEVTMRTVDDGNEYNEDTIEIENDTQYDLFIKFDGSGATNKVTFYHKECTSSIWCDHEVTTNVPGDDEVLYYSMGAITSDGTAGTVTLGIFEFEADAGETS